MLTEFHIDRLKEELRLRKEKNSRYSLRAFATFLKIDPSALSRILTGKQEMSIQIATQIIRKLKFSEEDQDRFILSIAQEKFRRAIVALNESVQGNKLLHLPKAADLLNPLKKSDEFLDRCFESLPTPAGMFSADGELIYANSEMRSLLPRGKVPSRDSAVVNRWRTAGSNGEGSSPSDFPCARALRGEDCSEGAEMEFLQENGTSVRIRVRAKPLINANGKVVGMFSVVQGGKAAGE